jgi:hypothetical protein
MYRSVYTKIFFFKNAVHCFLSEVVIQIIYDVSLVIANTSERDRNLQRYVK